MFVDASALVAIITDEAERCDFVASIQTAPHTRTSAIAVYEASHAVSRKTGLELHKACNLVVRLLDEMAIVLSEISRDDGIAAIDASRRYGKVAGHPARLNMGDCFSYAMAKRAGLPLLYKGDDFAQTDLA
jgi:ribonuclease VapC